MGPNDESSASAMRKERSRLTNCDSSEEERRNDAKHSRSTSRVTTIGDVRIHSSGQACLPTEQSIQSLPDEKELIANDLMVVYDAVTRRQSSIEIA